MPDATVARLPQYLRALTVLAERGTETVSSEALAAAAGVGSAKLRKDLSHLGSYGTRGVGYEVARLVQQISEHLGLTQRWSVVIIGIGNLGHALAGYGGFASRGFGVVGLFDDSPAVVGKRVNGLVVRPLAQFEAAVADERPTIAVLAVPAAVAQRVCDRVVATGVSSVLNFAPVVLQVPEGVHVRKVDLASELQILAFHEQRRAALARAARLVPGAAPAGRGTSGEPEAAAVAGVVR
ncbi:redox-sensing transcriptional repressor Rex [Kineococcus glutinatus]|uniref:redox-sensing transcriptional repressor Rex n=1 Tax=Kineococcus glutinatus TaxID=1070872 RepID=UPI003CD0B13A